MDQEAAILGAPVQVESVERTQRRIVAAESSDHLEGPSPRRVTPVVFGVPGFDAARERAKRLNTLEVSVPRMRDDRESFMLDNVADDLLRVEVLE
jgi:hypothetical protein